MNDIRNYSLLAHNTFGIEANCLRFLEYVSVSDAQKIASILTEKDFPLMILGAGSNLLLTKDFSGTVIHSAIKGIEMKDCVKDRESIFLRCGSGETFDDVVAYAVGHGYYGAENLSLIPGEVGASAVQNIGAYGVEAKDIIYEVEAVDLTNGNLVSFTNSDCAYSYRQSKLKNIWKNRYIITYVTYRLYKTFCPNLDYGNIRAFLEARHIDKPTAQELREVIIDIRKSKLPDPKVLGNAGSFFMNPIVSKDKFLELLKIYPNMPHFSIDDFYEKIPAGWMIEQCGWKGQCLGRAGVHDKQSLVLVNLGGATGADILQLCKAIQRDVKDRFSIEILPEVNIR